MKIALVLVPLLVLGWARTPEGLPVLTEPAYPTQENFNLAQFLGTWYDIAAASNCPYMQRHRGDAAISKQIVEKGLTEDKLKVTRTVLRHGTCKEMSADYELTDTPGRFFYHVERWGADVDAYVVHTNYDEYAIVIMSRQKAAGEKSTAVKLYSRSPSVRTTVMDDFNTLVRDLGMGEDAVTVKQNKGDCVPGEQVEETPVEPVVPQRLRRQVLPSLAAEEEGSGDDGPLFIGTEACMAETDSGPCFGMAQRYYYNSSSMSCHTFTYGGCLGNQNNFLTERDCLQRCRTEAVCHLPMTPEPCTGQPPVWAFDSVNGLCVAYKADICQANANKFYSKAECEEYCGVIKDEAELLRTN